MSLSAENYPGVIIFVWYQISGTSYKKKHTSIAKKQIIAKIEPAYISRTVFLQQNNPETY